ncbi:hypothetical protein BJ742DRAFT_681543 [Cladochytrium replicatum]|nr:hypothetical protein BJ742DRAFT_681543 [Cladochytrium replicatum]
MVRESNFNNPAAQQAAIIITPNQYDKRALTCADPLALTNSLVNLSYMTSISTLRIAYVLATDGGLELIVRILRRLRVAPDDSLSRFAYSAALTCLSNVAVRGNQRLRKRLVEAGVIPVIIDLLLKVVTTQVPLAPPAIELETSHNRSVHLPVNTSDEVARWLRSSRESLMSSDHLLTDILHRVDDMLLAIKLVAYLSKYPAIRAELHSGHSHNVFELVEVFTATSNLVEVRRWAIICMRNAFKRDSASNSGTSLRRCGNLKCGKWEEVPRQYSKCSRCRRVTYCSKTCQRSSWPLHKNWCLKYESTNTSSAAVAPGSTSAPPPAPTDAISTLPNAPVTTPVAPRHTHTPEITTGAVGAWGAPMLPLEHPIPPQPTQMDPMRDRVMMARRRESLMGRGQTGPFSFIDE